MSFSKYIATHLCEGRRPLCTAESTQARPLWCLLLLQTVQKNTVVDAFQLMAEDDIGICHINLSQEEAQNFRFLLFHNNQATVSLPCELLEPKWEVIAMRTNDCERAARQLLSRRSIAKQHLFIDSGTDGENLLLVCLGVEGSSKRETHECQWRSVKVIRLAGNRQHVGVLSQDFKLAVRGVFDASKVGVYNLEPARAHNVLPQDELFEQGGIGAEDVRKGFS